LSFVPPRPPPRPTLFPYTTLFRSAADRDAEEAARQNPGYLRAVLESLARRAGQGDAGAAAELHRLLGERPGLLGAVTGLAARAEDRKSTRLNSSHVSISYAVFCLK